MHLSKNATYLQSQQSKIVGFVNTWHSSAVDLSLYLLSFVETPRKFICIHHANVQETYDLSLLPKR